MMPFVRNCTAALLALLTAAATADAQQKPRNPTDTDVMIPGLGFNLAATITAAGWCGDQRRPASRRDPGPRLGSGRSG